MTTTRSATYGFRIPLFLVAGCLFHETDVSHAELPEPSIVLDVRTPCFFLDCIFSPDNRYLAVDCRSPGGERSSRRDHLRIWDLKTGQLVADVPNLPSRIAHVQFARKGFTVFTASATPEMFFFDRKRLHRNRLFKTRPLLNNLTFGKTKDISALSPNGISYVRSSSPSAAKGFGTVFEVRKAESHRDAIRMPVLAPLRELHMKEMLWTYEMKFLDEHRLLIAHSQPDENGPSENGSRYGFPPGLSVFDLRKTSAAINEIQFPEMEYGHCIWPSVAVAQEAAVFAVRVCGAVLIYDSNSLSLKRIIRLRENRHVKQHVSGLMCTWPYTFVSIAADGQRVLCEGIDKVTVWDTLTGHQVASMPNEGNRIPLISPDGTMVVRNKHTLSKTLEVWSVADLMK